MALNNKAIEPLQQPAGRKSTTRNKAERRDLWYPYLLIAPTMITLVVVGLVPFIFAIFISFHEMTYLNIGEFVWVDNYATLLGDPRFWNSLWVSFVFVLIAVPIEFALGLTGALILSQHIKLRALIIPALFIPTMMAPVVVALVWKIMLAGSWGFLSHNVLERYGILSETSAFASPELALYALIFVDIWQWTPFMTLAFFAGIQSLPVNPYRAAVVDGANAVQRFFRLTLPMLIPLFAVIGLLRMIDAFKVFDSIFLLTGGGPGTNTESISVLGYKQVFEFWEIGRASALAVVVWVLFFIFCNIFYQIAQKKLKAF